MLKKLRQAKFELYRFANLRKKQLREEEDNDNTEFVIINGDSQPSPVSITVMGVVAGVQCEFILIEGQPGLRIEGTGFAKQTESMYSQWEIAEGELSLKNKSLKEGLSEFPLPGTQDGIWPIGGHALIADAAAGKSLLTLHLLQKAKMNDLGVSFVGMGEPESVLPGSELDVILAIMISRLEGSDVLAIDSLREVLLDIAGDLRKGGVSKGIPKLLTTIQRLGVVLRMHLILVINPSDVSDAVTSNVNSDTNTNLDTRQVFNQLVSDMRSSLSVSTVIRRAGAIERGNIIPLSVDSSYRYGDRKFASRSVLIPVLSDSEAEELTGLDPADNPATYDSESPSIFMSDDFLVASLTGNIVK